MRPVIHRDGHVIGLQLDLFSGVRLTEPAAPAAPAAPPGIVMQPIVKHYCACPQCGSPLTQVNVSTALADIFGGDTSSTYSYCPNPFCSFDQIEGNEK